MRLFAALLLAPLFLWALGQSPVALAQPAAPPAAQTSNAEAQPLVLLADIDGIISAPLAHHVEQSIAEAEQRNAEALILRINTPGGLDGPMRDIIENIIDARVPVIAYVAPSGGRAASAGTYILYAAHLAAMAPGTNIGAATPIQLGAAGAPPEPDEAAPDTLEPDTLEQDQADTNAGALDRKMVNDAAALMRALAELRGRNGDWAERAVRLGEAISASEALERGAIEIIAEDVEDLLAQSNARTVSTSMGERTLHTANARTETIAPSWITQLLTVLANPNVAYLLMMIGIYGMVYEFAHPGTLGPGIIGAICLVLGLYALNLLPLNYAGLALIGFGIAFMLAEAFTPTFGILGIGGLIAFVVGSLMLIDTDIPEFQLDLWVILLAAALTGGFFLIALAFSIRAHRKRVATGREGLIDEPVEVLDWADGKGHVWAQSERWRALGPEALSPGAIVRVTKVEHLTLRVAPQTNQGDAP